MAVQSYLVFPEPGCGQRALRRLATIPGCEAVLADDTRLILLVTESDTPNDERRLRAAIDEVGEIQCMVMTFGEIDPDTDVDDPVAEFRKERKPRAGGVALPTVPHEVPA